MRVFLLNQNRQIGNAYPFKNGGLFTSWIDYEVNSKAFTEDLTPPANSFPLILKHYEKHLDSLKGFNHIGLLINIKFLDLLKEFSLPDYRIYKTPIIHKNEILDNYQYIVFKSLWFDVIDIEKTPFYKDLDENIQPINPFFEKVSAQKAFEKGGYPRPNGGIYLKPECANYDFFTFPGCPQGFVISEKLKNKLIEESISGIAISEIDWLHF
jgi:hypothetical protein